MALPGLLPPGTQFDLFRGTAAMKQDVDDMYPTTLGHTIKVFFYKSLSSNNIHKICTFAEAIALIVILHRLCIEF